MKYVLFGLIFSLQSYAAEVDMSGPPEGGPLQVDARININKIYNIDTVNETYQVDGYLVFIWKDERLRFDPAEAHCDPVVHKDQGVEKCLENDFWYPCCELVNVQGSRDRSHMRLEIYSDGKILYTERFFGTFFADMDFRRFPFDSQTFQVVLEPWGLNQKVLKFSSAEIFPALENGKDLISKWDVESISCTITNKVYDHLQGETVADATWSRVVFEVNADRKVGYFVWQVLLPLFIIIFSSFFIFWINDFSIQIGIGFSLMLTVAAFNFFSASILPKLPYNTFIESIITAGYIFIFFGILCIVINGKLEDSGKDKRKNKLVCIYRYAFPVLFFVTILTLYLMCKI
jgi:hypothetical protein